MRPLNVEKNRPSFPMEIRLLCLLFACFTLAALAPAATEAAPRIGLQSWTCRNMGFDEVVAFAGAHGIKYLQLIDRHIDPFDPPGENLRKKAVLEAHGLVCYTFGVAATFPDKEQNRRLFEFARLMGIKLIVVEPRDQAIWDNLEELVREYDIRLAIHNHGRGTTYGDPEQVKTVLADRDPRIGVCLDIGHASGAGYDVAQVFREYGADRVFDLHLKDKRIEKSAGGKDVSKDVAIGAGVSNYAGLFAELRQANWNGVMAIETDSAEFARSPGEFVDKAAAFVRANYAAGAAASSSAPRQPPTHANVHYGPHEQQVFDLFLARSDRPAPLVVFIHGGGFSRGDKRMLSPDRTREFLAAGISVASLNYRLSDVAPMPAAYMDCARAIQYLRHRAAEWNLDPARVAAIGGSAGAGTALWIAFHDDMADPSSNDPVARESTRLVCVALKNAQCSYDPRFVEQMGAARPNLERHQFFGAFYGLKPDEYDTPRAYRLYEEAAPINYLTTDDPPVMLTYGFPLEPITPATDIGVIIHNPLFGVRLKERMDKLHLTCIVSYGGAGGKPVLHGDTSTRPPDALTFIQEQFERARLRLN